MALSYGNAVLAVGVFWVASLLCKLFLARTRFQKLVKYGVAMPRWNPLLGHLKALKENSLSLPQNASAHVSFTHLSQAFPRGIFYLDLYPFSKPLVVVFSPYLASQIETLNLKRPRDIYDKIDAITDGPSVLSMHGSTWKMWRKLFSPGFSESYMMGLTGGIVQEVGVLCEVLRQMAKEKRLFQLEEATLRLTFDVIGLTSFNKQLHCQTSENPLANALRKQIEWTSYGTQLNPFKKYLSIQPIVTWYYSRTINRYLHAEIDKYLLDRAASEESREIRRSKSILEVIADQYLSDSTTSKSNAFKDAITPQLRALLLAGHDTTSSTLCFVFHMLHINPEVLERVRFEHDKVFGNDASQIQEIISTNPLRLNQIPYTTAVIKETLRLYAPAASIREGRGDIALVDEDGHRYPTKGCNIWTLSLALHRNSRVWKDAASFRPERWLVGPEDPMHTPKGGFRAFEQGPHACLGQPLAMLELKIALVATVREFEVRPAYEEWDHLHRRKGVRAAWGDRVYQAMRGGAGGHPDEGYPCRVAVRGS